ncbi:2-methylaconitate cis-trans isomerase PrpF family protein [Aliikangiella maris]|uniref:PrpF domain-containing protein n=2 Tax=Aliikangiella maris TaxID=3162458 RepID=A0ABV3MPC6_9GAMM
MSDNNIPATWMRGGTSKGVFFLKSDLPEDPDERDSILLKVMGSPDPYGKQIDGLGGATSSTSKIVIISPATKSDCDVNFYFGAVSINKPLIDYSGTCGNLASAVGIFAIEQGLVKPEKDGLIPISVWQENQQQRYVVHTWVKDGKPLYQGDYTIAGVNGSASPVTIEFLLPGLGAAHDVLPTFNPLDVLKVPGFGKIEASLIAAGNPTIFVRAADLDISLCDIEKQLNADSQLAELLESIRCIGAVAMNAAPSPEYAREKQPATPKIALIGEATDFISSHGKVISASDQDLSARILSMGAVHHAFTGTGTIAAGVAAAIPDTIIAQHLGGVLAKSQSLKLGHPGGVIEVSAHVVQDNGCWIAKSASLTRTARTLMKGQVFY